MQIVRQAPLARREEDLAPDETGVLDEAREEAPEPVSDRDRHHARGDVLDRCRDRFRLLTDPRLFFPLLHLLVEVGDAEATQSLPAAEEPGELAQTRPTTSARGSDRGDGDPSLRELFWGEEE